MALNPKNIAAFAPLELGDTILATPLYQALRIANPTARITALSQALPHPGLEGLDVFDSVIEYDPKDDLSRFDLLVLPVLCGDKDVRDHFNAHANIVSFERLHAAKRKSFGNKWDGRYSHLLFYRHQVELNMELAREAGYEGPPLAPFCRRGDSAPFERFSDAIGLFINTPVNEFQAMPNRQWPLAHWKQLVESLGVSKVFLMGGPTDRMNVERLARDTKADFAITNTLSEFTALCGVLRAVVTTDGGAMHAAATTSVPIVSLHGTSSPILLHPWIYPNGKSISILSPNSCSPCQRTFRLQACESGITKMDCMQNLDVRLVESALHELDALAPGTCLIKKGDTLMTKDEYLGSWQRSLGFSLNYNASRFALKFGVGRKTLPVLATPQRSPISPQ